MCVFQHADVIAVSYEARKLGVTKHMPTPTIRREYPSVKLVHVQVKPELFWCRETQSVECYSFLLFDVVGSFAPVLRSRRTWVFRGALSSSITP